MSEGNGEIAVTAAAIGAVAADGATSEAAGSIAVAGSDEETVPALSARMLNEFVYCPRLFYYEHVEGVFV